MKKITQACLVAVAVAFAASAMITSAEAGRKGSHRVGGYNSHGKGSHYVGGR